MANPSVDQPTYQELLARIGQLERAEAELREQQALLSAQNINLVRRSIELSDLKREMEDKNYELERIKNELEERVQQRTVELRAINENLKQEITERRQAEAALRESQERYQWLMDASPDPMVVYDIQGLATYINPAFTRVFGWTPTEVVKQRIDYVPDNVSDRTENLLARVIRGESLYSAETQRLTKDGRLLDISMSVATYHDRQGTPQGCVVNLRDITEHRKLEAQLQHAQKMQAVGTLAGGVAHEFNNLLQVISGYLEFLLLRKPAEDPDCKYLNRIKGTVERAKELVRELLTFSRKVESKPRPVDLNQQVTQVCKLLERTIPKMIKIELKLAPDLSGVYADPTQLEQITMNLASNARDAMPDGGFLLLETRNVSLDSSFSRAYPEVQAGEYVLLSVSDNGSGMDQDTLKHIFEPFFTTKGPGRGTGLGLSIVYGIISAHGGHITCYSEPSRGTTFHLYLPAFGAEREPVLEVDKEAAPMGGSGTILLVDDEPGILEMSREILQTYGYRALVAESGERALEIFAQKSPPIDLIILDLNMPGMGGHKCLQELQALEPQVKVLVASGYTAAETADENLKLGAVGFLGKPYSFKEILNKVREVLT